MSTVTSSGPSIRATVANGIESRLIEQIRRALHRSGYYEIQQITFSCHEGLVVLHGQVSSFYMKQIAQTIVLHIAEVTEVDNRLKVVYRTKRSGNVVI